MVLRRGCRISDVGCRVALRTGGRVDGEAPTRCGVVATLPKSDSRNPRGGCGSPFSRVRERRLWLRQPYWLKPHRRGAFVTIEPKTYSLMEIDNFYPADSYFVWTAGSRQVLWILTNCIRSSKSSG